MPNPIHTLGYIRRIQIIEQVEVYKNKEDSHGGPGHYPEERVLAQSESQIACSDIGRYLRAK